MANQLTSLLGTHGFFVLATLNFSFMISCFFGGIAVHHITRPNESLFFNNNQVIWIVLHHNIKGLVTMYGGLNSHMAIRSVELNIPAIIGAGHVLYNKWFEYDYVEINCFAKTVNKLNTY